MAKTISLYVLRGLVRELFDLIEAARKQPGETVRLDFKRVRELAEKITGMVS